VRDQQGTVLLRPVLVAAVDILALPIEPLVVSLSNHEPSLGSSFDRLRMSATFDSPLYLSPRVKHYKAKSTRVAV
jgi:hypothetical protein